MNIETLTLFSTICRFVMCQNTKTHHHHQKYDDDDDDMYCTEVLNIDSQVVDP